MQRTAFDAAQNVLKKLQAAVNIDVTPKTAYDKFAQEQTIENLLVKGYFHPDKINELEAYVESLDDDATAPKLKLKAIVKRIKETQKRIAQISAQGQQLYQRASRFMSADLRSQAQQMAAAQFPRVG